MRIALVFSRSYRMETTGVYGLRALSQKHVLTHFPPEDLSKIDPQQYDLFMTTDERWAED